MRATDTDAARDASNNKIGRYFSFGTLETSFYWIGSVSTKTANSYDHGLRYDTSTGKLYCDTTEVSLNGHNHDDTYLKLSGGTMALTSKVVLNDPGTLYSQGTLQINNTAGGEASIGYNQNGTNIWTVGVGPGSTGTKFSWWNTSKSKSVMNLDANGVLTA